MNPKFGLILLLGLSVAINFASTAPTDDIAAPAESDSSALLPENNEISGTLEEPSAVSETGTELNEVNLQENLRSIIDYQINEIAKVTEKRKQQGQEITNQVDSLLTHVQNLKAKVSELESHLRKLQQEAASTSIAVGGPVGGKHNAVVVLYTRTNYEGRSTTLDFTNCDRNDECCKSLLDLENDTRSIKTGESCVEMFRDRNCQGDSRKFYPGSDYGHSDFGSFNDQFSSGKPCYSQYL